MKNFWLVAVVALCTGCPNPQANCSLECSAEMLPAPACRDSNTAVTFTLEVQSCETGCTTVPQPMRCEFGCREGLCLSAPTTDAGSDAGHDAGIPDGGSRDASVDLCANVTCLTPPANRCSDAQHVEVSDVPGTCNEGLCQYVSHTEVCTGGCTNGACVDNPCQGVTCVTPPASICDDATTLRTYSPAGTCNAGTCSYTSQTLTCSSGCANGRCLNDPCAGVTCATPPATVCMGSTRRSSVAPGTCTAGNCSYAPLDTPCPFGCANGACLSDPCTGMTCATPPAAACFNANTLRTFAPTGTCTTGSCTYSPSDVPCPLGCLNGACINDPCAGVSCAMPPAATCMGPNSVRSYTSPGTCANGSCTYTSSVQSCPAPAATCADAVTRRTFAAACSNGTCGSTPTDTYCPGGCTAGSCVPVVCTRGQTRPCSADCFCEENLIDSEALLDLSASADHDIWVCGTGGSLMHFDGGSWAKTAPLTSATLWAMTKTTAGTLWAVGSNGTVLRNRDGGWEQVDAGTTATLRAIDGTENALYAVGERGTVAYFDGSTWSVRDAGLNVSLTGVTAMGSTKVAVGSINGSSPAAFVVTSTSITATPFPSTVNSPLTSVSANSGYITAVGSGGTLINYSASTWSSPVTMPNSQVTTYFSRIREGWVLGSRTYSGFGTLWTDRTSSMGASSSVSGSHFLRGDSVSRWDGFTFTPLSSPIFDFEDVWGSAPNQVWVVGGTTKGLVTMWNGTRFVSQPVAGTWANSPLHDVFGVTANDVYAVGDNAALLHFDGTGWTVLEYAPALATHWQAVHASSASNVWLAGYERLRRFNGTSWTTDSLTGFQMINDVFTFSSSEGWTVGTTARHRTASGWALVSTGTTGPLNSVWGSAPNDVWVGGTGGFVARWNGASFSPVATGTTADVTHISGRAADDVYFGFGNGTLKHWDGAALRPVELGIFDPVEGVWSASADEVWVVARGGVARHKSN